MPKRKLSSHKTRGTQQRPPDQRRDGLSAFKAGRFDQAIAAWTDLAPGDPKVAAALAEAHARRARSRIARADELADLRRALTLAPEELGYEYQLGLALHRAGDLAAAVESYRSVLAHDPGCHGAVTALALARLEQDPRAELASLPESTPEVRAALAPVQALLRGDAPTAEDSTPLASLWRGLALIRAGDDAARAALSDDRSLPTARATAIRRYYSGVAAARDGDVPAALEEWERVYHDESRRKMPQHQSWLLDNLATALAQRLSAQLETGDLDAAAATARLVLDLPLGNTALKSTLVQTLDRSARADTTGGDWARAASLWEDARKVVGASTGLGSPRPLLHNLALAHEAQERWTEAAEVWRAMLRTRPRAGAPAGRTADGPTATQWDWVRKRVIECYKRAGQPGEAVAVYRQVIKADPDDMEARLQLADSLVANEQEQAALNELRRAVQIDPHHVEAKLRLANVYSTRGEWYAAEHTLRAVIEQEPTREDVRRQLARLLLERGQRYHDRGLVDAAAAAFAEGKQLVPDDYQFPLNLARIEIERRKLKRARELLDHALKIGADQPDAYLETIDCWAVAGKLDEARAVLARAEEALTPTPRFYVDLGALLFERRSSPTLLSSLAPTPPEPDDSPWSQLATEMLDRAVSLRPDDGHIHFEIAGELLPAREDLALRYAETGARLLPDDLHGLTLLGLLQGLNEHKRDAKQTLQRAARLARQQGNAALVQKIESLRRQVDSPFFRFALQMGPILGDLDPNELDFDDSYFDDPYF